VTIVDLSMHLDEQLPHHRLHSPLRLLPGPLSHWQSGKWLGPGEYGPVSFANEQIVMGGHSGTHMDAPFHADPAGATAERVPLDDLVGPARVLDVRDGCGPRHTYSLASLQAVAGAAPLPRIVLLRTGWYEMSPTDLRRYFDNSVGISRGAAVWLRECGVSCIGIDAPSIDAPDARGAPAHMELLRRAPTVAVIENLVNLDRLPVDVPLFVAAPLPLKGCSGSPARCFAVIDRDHDPRSNP
jgi:kynurenine formamidase